MTARPTLAGLALAGLAACGGGAAAPDAAPADAADACTATWSGNFSEVATAADPCATMTPAGELAIQAPSARLGASLAISIDLGTATAGSYSSDGVAGWSASATLTILTNSCIYQAGSGVTPTGVFALTLTSAAAPHGTLALDQAVLATVYSICGDPLTEHLELAF